MPSGAAGPPPGPPDGWTKCRNPQHGTASRVHPRNLDWEEGVDKEVAVLGGELGKVIKERGWERELGKVRKERGWERDRC